MSNPVTASTPQRAVAAPPLLRNYLAGAWRRADTSERLTSRDPWSGSPLAHVPCTAEDEVDTAVKAAAAAQPAWAATPPAHRARALMTLRNVLAEHHERLAEAVTQDMGKTIEDARAETWRGIESVEAAVAVPHLLKGENLTEVAKRVDVSLHRDPVGVVAAITPFNFPAMIPLWFIPYALACGNAIVLKPSEQDPTPAALLFELIDSTGAFPPGTVSLIHGTHQTVNALIDHDQIDAVSFVGSAATARLIAARATANGTRVQALGGAKNAIVLEPDADPQIMLPGVLGSAFGAAGQRCLAGSVAVLTGTPAQQDESLRLLAAGARGLRCGPGSDPATDVAPLISAPSRERVAASIERAIAGGAEAIVDGREQANDAGTLLGPTILDRVDQESECARDELFGPVLTVIRVPTLDAALRWINRGRYGNASVIYTRSGAAARQFRRHVDAGMVGVNVGVAAPVAWFPFSGRKDSMDGDLHANGTDAIRFYTQTKVVTEKWD